MPTHQWRNGYPCKLHALVLAIALVCGIVQGSPQFHLSLIGPASRDSSSSGFDFRLDWVTNTSTNASAVLYGASKTAMTQRVQGIASGQVEEAKDAFVACWTALLPRLKAGESIFYAREDDPTSVYSFAVPSSSSWTWAVFGDLASQSQGTASAVSWPALTAEKEKGAYHGILNLGDIAYELTRENGRDYMDAFDRLTSQVPMQITIGNHEHNYAKAPLFALQNYERRFRGLQYGAGRVSGTDSSEFYSFSQGLVHFVLLNTEVYGDEAFFVQADDGTWSASESARRQIAEDQAAWLEYDLSRVNRTETPYVVLGGHRPYFKTPGKLKKGNKFAEEIVPLLDKYHVDLYVCGHEHTYMHFEESTYGSYRLPPMLIPGSPGNLEYVRPVTEIDMGGFVPKRIIPNYGYGYLTATPAALLWQWGSTGSDGGHKPKPTPWTLEDKVAFSRQDLPCCTEAAGKSVKTPMPIDRSKSGDAAGSSYPYADPSSGSSKGKKSSNSAAPMGTSASTRLGLLACTLISVIFAQQ